MWQIPCKEQGTKRVMNPTAHPLWEPNVWYIRQFWDERRKIDNPYMILFTWVSQVCNCRQLLSECVKFLVKNQAKWEICPTARPVWEPNVWYIRTFWDERLKIDNSYRVLFTWVSEVCNCRQLFAECVEFTVKNKAKWEIYPTARPVWEPNVWYIRQFWDERLKIDTPHNGLV